MIWTVEFDDRARKELRKLDKSDQKPGVTGQEAQVLTAHLHRPTDEPVPAADGPQGRRSGQAGDGPPIGVDDVFQLLVSLRQACMKNKSG